MNGLTNGKIKGIRNYSKILNEVIAKVRVAEKVKKALIEILYVISKSKT